MIPLSNSYFYAILSVFCSKFTFSQHYWLNSCGRCVSEIPPNTIFIIVHLTCNFLNNAIQSNSNKPFFWFVDLVILFYFSRWIRNCVWNLFFVLVNFFLDWADQEDFGTIISSIACNYIWGRFGGLPLRLEFTPNIIDI